MSTFIGINIYTEVFPVETASGDPIFAVYLHTAPIDRIDPTKINDVRKYLCPWEWPADVTLIAWGLSNTKNPDTDKGSLLTLQEIDPATVTGCVDVAKELFDQLVSTAETNPNLTDFFGKPDNASINENYAGTTWIHYLKQFVHAPAPLPQGLNLVKFVQVQTPLPPDVQRSPGYIRILPQFNGAPLDPAMTVFSALIDLDLPAEKVSLRYPGFTEIRACTWKSSGIPSTQQPPQFVAWNGSQGTGIPGAPENLEIPLFDLKDPNDPATQLALNNIQGFGALLRPVGGDWTNLNLAKVRFQSKVGGSSVSLGVSSFVSIPSTQLTLESKQGSTVAMAFYKNVPELGDDIPLGIQEIPASDPNDSQDVSPFPKTFDYKIAYPDQGQLPLLLYGREYEVYAFPVGHCGDVPVAVRGNAVWKVNPKPKIAKRDVSSTKQLLRTHFSLPTIRLVSDSIFRSKSSGAEQTWPSIPPDVEPLAYNRLGTEYSGRPLILLRPINEDNKWLVDLIPAQVTISVTPPTIPIGTWERCGLINRVGVNPGQYALLWEGALEQWYGLGDDQSVGTGMPDPALISIQYRRRQVWPRPEQAFPAFTSVAMPNPRLVPASVEILIGSQAGEAGVVYEYELCGVFDNGSGKPTPQTSILFLVEVVSSGALTKNDVTLGAGSLTGPGFEWQIGLANALKLSQWDLYSECQVDFLRWSWGGQPLHSLDDNGLPFDQVSKWPPDQDQVSQLFPYNHADIETLDFNTRQIATFDGKNFTALVPEIKPGGLLFVGKATLFHRYRGLLAPSTRSTCDAIRSAVRIHAEPCRFTGMVPPPQVALVLPTTLTSGDVANPGFFVILNEEWYRDEVGGLADRLEVDCCQVSDPTSGEAFFELSPDPILNQTAVPLRGCEIEIRKPEAAIGLTNESVASGITYPRCAFFVPAPVVTDIDDDGTKNAPRLLWWHFYRLRFRRRLAADWLVPNSQELVSEWSQPIWAQVLPPMDWTLSEDGSLYSWNQLLVNSSGTFALAKDGTPVALSPTPSDNNCHRLYLLFTRMALDNLLGKRSEVFVSFVPYDKAGQAAVMADFVRVVELQTATDSPGPVHPLLTPDDLSTALFGLGDAAPLSRITRIGQRQKMSSSNSVPAIRPTAKPRARKIKPKARRRAKA